MHHHSVQQKIIVIISISSSSCLLFKRFESGWLTRAWPCAHQPMPPVSARSSSRHTFLGSVCRRTANQMLHGQRRPMTRKQNRKAMTKVPSRSSPTPQGNHQRRSMNIARNWSLVCNFGIPFCVLAMLGVVIMVVEMEVSRILYENKPNLINIILKSVNSFMTIILVFCLIKYWNVKIEIFKTKHLVHSEATVWSIPAFKKPCFWKLPSYWYTCLPT